MSEILSDSENVLTSELTIRGLPSEQGKTMLDLVVEQKSWIPRARRWSTPFTQKYQERKQQEEEDRGTNLKEIQEEKEHDQRLIEIIEKTGKKDSIDKMEEALCKEKGDLSSRVDVAQRLLADAAKRFTSAVGKRDLLGIKAATKMVEMAKVNTYIEKVNTQRSEQVKLRAKIGRKG